MTREEGQSHYKNEESEKKEYLEGLVGNTKRGKPHLIKGDIFLLSYASDEIHPVLRLPVSSSDAIDISRSARTLDEGPLPGAHWLDAPLRPARKKIKANEAMTD